MADLSQYGTVSSAPPDLSAYGVISGGAPKDDGSGAVKGFVQNSPIGAVKGVADFIRHPIDTVSGMVHQNAELLDKAKEAHEKGDNLAAAFHLLNYVLPGGPALDDAGEDFKNGHITRALAKTLGLATTVYAGAKAPASLESATSPSSGGGSMAGDLARKLAVKVVAKGTRIPGAESAINTVLDALKSEPEAQTSRPSSIAIPALRDRPPLRVPDTESAPAPDATPITSELPSGRKPGGIQNQQPLVPGKSSTAEAHPALTEFAQKIGFDDFAGQPGDAQKTILELFKASQEAPKPRPFIPSRPRPIGIPATPEAELAAAQSPEGLDVPIEPKTELESLLERSINGEKVAEQAKAELNDHLKLEALKKTESIIDKHQTTRALKLGRFLQDYGITPEHIDKMTPEEWHQVGSVADVDSPSATTIQKTKDLLKMGQQ